MLYHWYELNHAMMAPLRAAGQWQHWWLEQAYHPLANTYPAKVMRAAWDVFDSLTKRYGKPSFGLTEVVRDGETLALHEEVVLARPFCQLRRFNRAGLASGIDPKILMVAPLSGHYATLLRDTVAALAPNHEVYITDWADARTVPLAQGSFTLEDYIGYLLEFIRFLGPDTHVIAVCQPGPAALAATALLAADDDPCQPATLTIMGSPIDPRLSPTEPNRLATTRPLSWFEQNVIMQVPFPNPGFMRRVYPGFLQLGGFMSMNLDRHMAAYRKHFNHLVVGDGDSVSAHRSFYDEYLAVMDLPAEYYLDTLKVVFQEHHLPRGLMQYRGRTVEPARIRKTGLLTIEGELDDISGIGQTQAAHTLCSGLAADLHEDYIQPGVGHYGVFNGSRWRSDIAPRIHSFIRAHPRSCAG
jgi:poly(3-hydroxybutyrate) depolymerase